MPWCKKPSQPETITKKNQEHYKEAGDARSVCLSVQTEHTQLEGSCMHLESKHRKVGVSCQLHTGETGWSYLSTGLL